MKRRRFGLGMKMGIGFGILLIIVIALGSVTILRMQGVQREASMLDQEYVQEVELSNHLQQFVLQTMYNMRGYGLSEEAHYLEEAQKDLELVKQTLEDAKILAASSPHLEKLKEALPEIETQVTTYEDLVTRTVESNTQIAEDRSTLGTAADQYMQNCYEYLREQNGSLHTEAIADMPPIQLITRQQQITLVSNVIDLGNATRIETQKAQALRKPQRIQEALKNFDLIEQKLEQLRPMSYLEENLERIDNIKTAVQIYRTAMNDLFTQWTALEKLNQQRDTAAQAIIEQVNAAGDKGIEETKQIANTTTSVVSSTALMLIIGFSGAIVVGVVIALLLTRNIVNPMQQGVAFASAIAAGDLNTMMAIKRHDEIGILAETLEDMRKRIQAVLEEISSLIEAVQGGRLDVRGDADAFEGGWRELLVGMNNVIDAFMAPFNVTAEYLDRLSKGDLPEKIREGYQGDFREVTNNLNQCIDAISGLVAETGSLTEAAVEGKLDVRGAASQFGGEYGAIITGVNNTIDTLVGHIDQLPVPVMILDPEFRIRYINKAGAKMAGRSGEQLLGQRCYDQFQMSDCQTANCACARAMRSGNIEAGDTEAHPNGKDLLISYNGLPIRDQAGTIIGAVEILMDQTEIKQAMSAVEQQNWMRTGQAELSNLMRGDQEPIALSKSIITYLAKYLGVQTGAMYLVNNQNGEPVLQLSGSYAYTWRKGINNAFRLGEGFVGQAALEQESIGYTDLPEDYLSVGSGLGATKPKYVLVTPFMYEGNLKGVIEVGATEKLTETQLEFLNQAAETIAVAFHSAQTRQKMQNLLEQTQRQAEELQAQQEHVRAGE